MKSPGPNSPLLIRSLSFVIIDLLAPNCMERTTARKENILTGELYLPKLMQRHLKRSKARQDSRPCLEIFRPFHININYRDLTIGNLPSSLQLSDHTVCIKGTGF